MECIVMNDDKTEYCELTLIPADFLESRLAAYHRAGFAEQFHALWNEASEAMTRARRLHWERIFADRSRNSSVPPEARETRIQKAIEDMRIRLTSPIDALWVA